MNSFSERMAEAREVTATRRARDQSTGKQTYRKVESLDSKSWDALVYRTKKEWRSDVLEFLNQFQQHCLNGDDDITQF